MDKELALRTFAYLIEHYKTHYETIINSQEIEAIEFMLKNNEHLEQQCKKQKEVIDKTIEKLYCWGETLDPAFQKDLLDILKEGKND